MAKIDYARLYFGDTPNEAKMNLLSAAENALAACRIKVVRKILPPVMWQIEAPLGPKVESDEVATELGAGDSKMISNLHITVEGLGFEGHKAVNDAVTHLKALGVVGASYSADTQGSGAAVLTLRADPNGMLKKIEAVGCDIARP